MEGKKKFTYLPVSITSFSSLSKSYSFGSYPSSAKAWKTIKKLEIGLKKD